MKRIVDLENGDVVQIETGYTNWNRKDNEFNCTVDGRTEKGLVILNAMNAVCFDGRNTIQPYFAVDKETAVLESGMYYKIPGCYVLWNVIGMDRKGRFILKTRKKVTMEKQPDCSDSTQHNTCDEPGNHR